MTGEKAKWRQLYLFIVEIFPLEWIKKPHLHIKKCLSETPLCTALVRFLYKRENLGEVAPNG